MAWFEQCSWQCSPLCRFFVQRVIFIQCLFSVFFLYLSIIPYSCIHSVLFFLNIGQCIYLGLEYIRGVTVHKIHGSVRYDTVVSRFGTFSIRGGNWLCRNVFLNHEGEPMDITQARVCTRVCTMQTKCKIYAGEHLNQSFHYKQKVKVKNGMMTELSASDACDKEWRIYFNICW